MSGELVSVDPRSAGMILSIIRFAANENTLLLDTTPKGGPALLKSYNAIGR